MPFNAISQNNALTGGIGNAITHVGLHQTSTEPGTGTNAAAGEATGGTPPYARVAVAWGTAASGQRSNSGALTINAPAGTYGWLTLWNAATGNTSNYLGYAHMNNTQKGFATCDAADVTANTITVSAHGLVNTNRVMVYNVYAESLPAGLVEGTQYFVVGATTDTFQVSLTSGGAAVDITGIGEMAYFNFVPEVFAADGQVTVAIGALVLDATAV
jgi:hypothetical protein